MKSNSGQWREPRAAVMAHRWWNLQVRRWPALVVVRKSEVVAVWWCVELGQWCGTRVGGGVQQE